MNLLLDAPNPHQARSVACSSKGLIPPLLGIEDPTTRIVPLLESQCATYNSLVAKQAWRTCQVKRIRCYVINQELGFDVVSHKTDNYQPRTKGTTNT